MLGLKAYVPLVAVDGLLCAADGILYTTEPSYLITDRTQADVDRVRDLAAKGLAGMTDDELAEWLAGMRGAYNASDLNRVGAAVEYLADRLRQMGYAFAVSVKTDWALTDIPKAPDMDAYLASVAAVRGVLALPAGVPAVPGDMQRLTYQEANDIEQILEDIDAALDRIRLAWYYSGDLYAGEV